MLNLAQLENDLSFLIKQAEALRLREGVTSPNFIAVNNEIMKLNAIRDEALGARNTLSYNPNVAYANNSQVAYQQQSQVMFSPVATAGFQPVTTRPGLDDNKFASRSGISVGETVQATVVNEGPKPIQVEYKPKEGDEFPYVCYQGITYEKEVDDDKRTYKYVLYGDDKLLDMPIEKIQNLPLPSRTLPEIRKMVIGDRLKFAFGKLEKTYYSEVSDMQLGPLVNKLKEINVVKTSIDNISPDTSRLLSGIKKYYTSIINLYLKGLRYKLRIDDFGSDLPSLKTAMEKKPLETKVKFNKFMTEIQNEFNSNLTIDFMDESDIARATHVSPVFFVEEGMVLGNIYDALDENEIVSVKKDSNPILFKMLTAMMDGEIDGSRSKSHIIISHCNYDHEYFAFAVVRDVFDRFIISRIHL